MYLLENKIDFSPKFNCFDSVIVEICRRYKREYKPYFLDAFNFIYFHEKLSLNNMFAWSDVQDFSLNLNKFCGISCYSTMDSSKIKEQISVGSTVVIKIDFNNLNLEMYNHIDNRMHYIIVESVEDFQYVCSDPYYNISDVKLDKIYIRVKTS
jgi:hypothetical protein